VQSAAAEACDGSSRTPRKVRKRFPASVATGAFVLTTPTALADLRVGDQLLICLHEEMSDDKESFAEKARSAEEDAAAAAGAP
jgi:hypothetical protein